MRHASLASFTLGLSTITLLATAVACGSGSSASDLLAGDAAADSSIVVGADGSADGSLATDGGANADGALVDTGVGTDATRPADDAGVTADGGIDPPGAGPGGDTGSISCGATTCLLASETCCITEPAGAGDRAYACVLGSTCPAPNGGDVVALKCTGAANCAAGTVCCVDQNNDDTTSTCKATCGGNEAQLCDPKAGDAGGCPSSDPCSNKDINDWNLPNTFGTCGGQGN